MNDRPNGTRGRVGHLVSVQCWCQADFVGVHIALVRAGLTGSCGATECKDMARTAWLEAAARADDNKRGPE